MSHMIPGPAGTLEAVASGYTGQNERWLVICHPHPQFGGSMDDAVLQAVVAAAEGQRYGVFRFNFRGVGKSEGTFGGGTGEVDDLLAVVTYLDDEYTCVQAQLVVAGYSFGAAIAANALTQGITPRANLWVSPPIGRTALPPEALNWPGPKTLFCGEHDEYCPAADAEALCSEADPPITFHRIPGATHFYPGAEAALGSAVTDFLNALESPAS